MKNEKLEQFYTDMKDLLEMERTEDHPDEARKLARLEGIQCSLYHLDLLAKKYGIKKK